MWIHTLSLETNKGPSCVRHQKSRASPSQHPYVNASDKAKGKPEFPLRKKGGKCLGSVDLADLLRRSSQMAAFNVGRLYPMSPADKIVPLSGKNKVIFLLC